MIELRNIHQQFNDGANKFNQVLRGLDLKVDEGSFVAIQGASGSGKTTLLSIIGTLLEANSGTYLFNGKDIYDGKTDFDMLRNKEIGFVFQDHKLMPQLNALENILLPTLAYQQEASSDDIEHAKNLLDITKISNVANQYPESLSGGEASRVAACRALIMKPKLLLADEPTGQLDSENARNIANLLSEINKTLNTTIIMVSHSAETAAVADKVYQLKDGVLHT